MSTFNRELQLRIWLALLTSCAREEVARGTAGPAAIVVALTRVIGRPPVRSAQKRQFVALVVEMGVPADLLEKFLAPAPPARKRKRT